MDSKVNYKKCIEATIDSFINQRGINISPSIKDKMVDSLVSQETVKNSLNTIMDGIGDTIKDVVKPMNIKIKIPNGQAEQPFESSLEIIDSLDKYDEIYIETIDIDENIGIKWDVDSQKLIGKPENGGEFVLKASGIIRFAKGYSLRVTSDIRFTVIPNPKKLWRDIPPDTSKPHPKENEDSGYFEIEGVARLIYASRRGRSHAHIGSFRDDDVQVMVNEKTGWSVLAVADGAGSYSMSRKGSEIVVKTTTEYLLESLSGESGKILEELYLGDKDKFRDEIRKELNSSIVNAVHKGIQEISNEAKKMRLDTKEFSTTLILVAHKKTIKGHFIISFWVGDGALVVYKKGEEVRLLGTPDGGEFAGQTRFLDFNVYDKTSERFKILLEKDMTSLMLLTDGVSDPFFEDDKALGDIKKWDSFWNGIKDKIEREDLELATKELLAWLDFWSKGNHDDRTIALLIPIKQEDKENATDKEG